MTYEFKFEFVILGETSVGKSSILKQFTDREFNDLTEATVGVDFGVKNLIVKDKPVKVYIWDTAGQESYKSLTKFYIRNRVCAIIVYDITNYDSFAKVQKWIDFVREVASNEIIVLLVGNKSDLESNRRVPYGEAKKYAEANHLIFTETSAKTSNEGCQKIFEVAATMTMECIQAGKIDPSNEIFGVKYGPLHQRYNKRVDSAASGSHNANESRTCCLF
ncbi:MAG: hypothetical protein MHMPM18_002069 [Marteilia pararefringens]